MVSQWNTAPDRLAKIFEYGNKAAELDDSQPTAHETLAYAHLADRDHQRSVAAARRAVSYDPNSAELSVSLAEILSFAGQAREAIPLIEQAMRLNPRYTPNYLWALGHAHKLLGNYDEAIAALKRALTRNPDHFVSHLLLAACYVEIGDLDAARAEAREILRISPNYSRERGQNQSPYADPSVTERQYECLAIAGLK